MSIQPSAEPIVCKVERAVRPRRRIRARRLIDRLVAVAVALVFLGGGAVDTLTQMRHSVNAKVYPWNWDIVTWEIEAVTEKVTAAIRRPTADMTAEEQTAHVLTYLERAREISDLERKMERIYSDTGGVATAESTAIQQQIDTLRAEQEVARPAAEVILETQITDELSNEGIGWSSAAFPPVWFTFTEPPKKLVISPRGRIANAHYAMLQPTLPVEERERIEDAILAQDNLSAYVTNIGGLGAYPTQVIAEAPVDWVLSTVAHEWVHNYLTLFPLGFNYLTSSDLMIMNETVADIVGDEVGLRALQRYYPAVATALAERKAAAESDPSAPPVFDFRREMRHTREIADLFLALGRIEDAEEYMEIRRLLFVENGYPIRKLNQAYFAFHGSYGTGAAATSPIGPKMEELRSLTPDIRTFLETVRGFTSPADLDEALERWRTVSK